MNLMNAPFKDVVLEHRLEKAIQRINPWISADNLRRIISEFTRAQFPNLIEANQSMEHFKSIYIKMQDVGKGK